MLGPEQNQKLRLRLHLFVGVAKKKLCWDDAEMSIHAPQLRAEQILIWTLIPALRRV